MSYIGLHQHSTYSLLDGYARIPDLVRKSKELGWSATAITDHNHLLGIPDFQQECKKQNIKPLLGIEMYYTFDTSILSAPLEQRHQLAERDAIIVGGYTKEEIMKLSKSDLTQLHKKFGYDTYGYHILFIAKDQQGWNNLVKLQSESSRLCTFNGRYHCDLKLLEKYHEGIICTTACIASFSSRMLYNGRAWMAKRYLTSLHQIFGQDFYLEIQPYNVRQQHKTNLFYHDWGEHNGIKTVATNDSHWVDKEDALEHDILLCIGTGEKQSNNERMHYEPVFWIKSETEMINAFKEQAENMTNGKIPGFTQKQKEEYLAYCYQAVQNTQEIADKVEPDIRLSSNTYLFPSVKIEKGKTPEQVLRESAEQGLERYLEKNKDLNVKVYKDRLEEELVLICSKGFAPYFLTVQEFINWCDTNNIPTGPGRGSAAGSLTLLCLGVTKVVDPIKTKLWFSRFITKDRKDLPDIDCDISWLNRGKVIEHLKDVYGTNCVAHIGTVIALKVKSAIKDVARVLEVPFAEALKISKWIDEIDSDPNLSFKTIDSWKDGTLDDMQKYKKFKVIEYQYPEVFAYARKFEGIPRQIGVHASGVLVTPCNVTDIFPVRYVDGVQTTLWTGVQVESFKSCKIDLLGLKNLDLIDIAIKMVDKKLSILDLYDTINFEEQAIYKMIRSKKTDAIFQLESGTMKNIIETIKPTCFEDIVVINSVARPGPLSCNMHIDYAKRKAGDEKISYPIRGCDDILKPTFGIIPYQELLMAISKRVAGFDDTQADSLMRKCVA